MYICKPDSGKLTAGPLTIWSSSGSPAAEYLLVETGTRAAIWQGCCCLPKRPAYKTESVTLNVSFQSKITMVNNERH